MYLWFQRIDVADVLLFSSQDSEKCIYVILIPLYNTYLESVMDIGME